MKRLHDLSMVTQCVLIEQMGDVHSLNDLSSAPELGPCPGSILLEDSRWPLGADGAHPRYLFASPVCRTASRG